MTNLLGHKFLCFSYIAILSKNVRQKCVSQEVTIVDEYSRVQNRLTKVEVVRSNFKDTLD